MDQSERAYTDGGSIWSKFYNLPRSLASGYQSVNQQMAGVLRNRFCQLGTLQQLTGRTADKRILA